MEQAPPRSHALKITVNTVPALQQWLSGWMQPISIYWLLKRSHNQSAKSRFCHYSYFPVHLSYFWFFSQDNCPTCSGSNAAADTVASAEGIPSLKERLEHMENEETKTHSELLESRCLKDGEKEPVMLFTVFRLNTSACSRNWTNTPE